MLSSPHLEKKVQISSTPYSSISIHPLAMSAAIFPASLALPRPTHRSLSSLQVLTPNPQTLTPTLSGPSRPPPLTIRMGGGPRTYPGGVSKWQWKRMQGKKAKQLLKARLARERHIYEMRKRAELKAAVTELEKPWELVDKAPALFSASADEQVKALADRFQRPGGFNMWSERDGPRVFTSPVDGLPSERFFPKGVVHSIRPYGIASGDDGNGKEELRLDDWIARGGGGVSRRRRRRERKGGDSGGGDCIDVEARGLDSVDDGVAQLGLSVEEETESSDDGGSIRRISDGRPALELLRTGHRRGIGRNGNRSSGGGETNGEIEDLGKESRYSSDDGKWRSGGNGRQALGSIASGRDGRASSSGRRRDFGRNGNGRRKFGLDGREGNGEIADLGELLGEESRNSYSDGASRRRSGSRSHTVGSSTEGQRIPRKGGLGGGINGSHGNGRRPFSSDAGGVGREGNGHVEDRGRRHGSGRGMRRPDAERMSLRPTTDLYLDEGGSNRMRGDSKWRERT